MFSYYGSKSKVIDYYPSPKHSKIIEPFAGSARYALKWFDRDVLLVDKYDVVIEVWHYLQQASEKDIIGLPFLGRGDVIPESISGVERLFLGFIVADGAATPQNKTTWFSSNPEKVKSRLISISKNLYKIRHWKIRQGSYADITNENATWFIDPPYQTGGHKYPMGNSVIDFAYLSEWCKSRVGQVIVCENTKSDWLPFSPMCKFKGAYSTTTEAIWSNHRTGFEATQLGLFEAA